MRRDNCAQVRALSFFLLSSVDFTYSLQGYLTGHEVASSEAEYE